MFFYINKSFNPRTSFNLDFIDYDNTRKRLNVLKIEDIIIYIKDILFFIR